MLQSALLLPYRLARTRDLAVLHLNSRLHGADMRANELLQRLLSLSSLCSRIAAATCETCCCRRRPGSRQRPDWLSALASPRHPDQSQHKPRCESHAYAAYACSGDGGSPKLAKRVQPSVPCWVRDYSAAQQQLTTGGEARHRYTRAGHARMQQELRRKPAEGSSSLSCSPASASAALSYRSPHPKSRL
jgi:hypothetical protein